MDISLIISARCFDEGQTPAQNLSKMLTLGDEKETSHNLYQQLLAQFKLQLKEQDFAQAAITAMSDLDSATDRKAIGEKHWLRADPVYLHADISSLILFDSQKFNLEKDEALELIEFIQPTLAEEDLTLCCGDHPTRWYLQLDQPAAIKTTSPARVNDQDFRAALLSGPDQTYWRGLGNEIQMLLHECPINLQRQQRGQPPINSLWFWGAGSLPKPELQHKQAFSQIISNDINVQGMAHWLGIPFAAMTDDVISQLKTQDNKARILIVLSTGDLNLSAIDDQSAWLLDQDRRIIKPLLNGLEQAWIQTINLISEDYSGVIKHHHRYRFWRKWLARSSRGKAQKHTQ